MSITLNESQLDDESDDYLIELMGMKQDFPNEAMEAYGKIYFRYWDVMLVIAQGVAKNEEVAEDLLADTFSMIYNKASTFDKRKINRPENIRLSIQKWMTVIMGHIFYDNYLDEAYKRKSNNENVEDSFIIDKKSIKKHFSDEYDEFIESLEESENSVIEPYQNQRDSENIIQVREYISLLSERDRDIILAYYNHYMPGKKTPTILLDDLVKRWGTTRDNIRKILEKFRRSIKEALQPKLFIRK